MTQLTRFARLPVVCLAIAVVATNTAAQDLTHPLQMKLPASDFSRPDPSDFEINLRNGLVAYVAVADQVPMVTLSAFVRAGKVSDDKQGAAEVLADALRRSGPATSSPEQFTRSLRNMTAEYTVDLHDEWTEMSLNVPTEDLSEALRLFAGLVMSPAISEENIDRLAGAGNAGDSDLGGESGPALYEGSLTAAVKQFYGILYRDHPLGEVPGSKDFKKLTTQDVAAFHQRFFVPGNMTLAIAGDIDREAIESAIDDLFSEMTSRDAPEQPRLPDIKPMKAEQHNFPVNKLQSWLVFGHDLPQVPLADQAALEVMNYILAGGHLWTRMTIETRYKYGYTNDASGFLEDRWAGPGSYTFRSYSRPEVIGNIYENMMREIIRIQEEPVAEGELFVAKGALTDGSFQIRYLDGYAIARSFAIEKLRYGNHDRSASFVRRIGAVNAKEVQDAANKYIRPDNMQVILVGEETRLIN